MHSATSLIIAGSRSFTDFDLLCRETDEFVQNLPHPIEIICGMARGADLLGYEYAELRGFSVQEFPADWNGHWKKRAGIIRNREMAMVATHLIAFWDGVSSGTKDMIEVATNMGIPSKIVRFNPHHKK